MTSEPPDRPLKIPSSGLAKASDLRALMADLGPRVGLRSGHQSQPPPLEVRVKAPTKTLTYHQLDKPSGVAKFADLDRIHQKLLKAVPAAVTRPFRVRRNDGTLHRSDVIAFHKHWLSVFKAQNQETDAS